MGLLIKNKDVKMFTFIKRILILAIALEMLPYNLGCKHDLPTKNAKQDESIFGTWGWIESRGGLDGRTVITPETQGSTEKLILNLDSTYQSYRDDSLMIQGKFTISREKSPLSSDTLNILRYEGQFLKQQSITLIGQDTLSLFDLCYDCFGHIYHRM